MAAAIQTLSLDVHYTITRDIIAPTQRSPSGGGGVMFRRLYERPLYQFTLRAVHEHRASAQALYGFAHYHQGDIAFWYSGDIWATPHTTTAALIGFGDGARTHFFLPNRHILSGPTIKVNGSGASHLTAAPGSSSWIALPAWTCSGRGLHLQVQVRLLEQRGRAAERTNSMPPEPVRGIVLRESS
jgi:hypothetical protein